MDRIPLTQQFINHLIKIKKKRYCSLAVKKKKSPTR